jgi:phosphatidylserine/phosphatidylglycerophosphate/cardiolipin synthase-like enzyme/uncharacterized membrane protein YdjX (TVP38/TMEM64 family)
MHGGLEQALMTDYGSLGSSILRPDHNCWRVDRAERAAFLIDGADYYRACRDAISRAQSSVYILGWDIDSRVELVRDGQEAPGAAAVPTRLGELLRTLVTKRRSLHVYLLVWDFAMIYALEREWLPEFKLKWGDRYRRLHVHMDDQHPPGGCHHQKVVVVDDTVAFVGGLDLTRARWDTSEHAARDLRRVDAGGHAYPPFHDVQLIVAGDIARSLGDLARERWYQATGRRLTKPRGVNATDPWPSWLEPDVEQLHVGISRTAPPFDGAREIREVERLYLDSIAGARRSIVIENQFLTSNLIGDALAKRLADPQGPEIVVLLRLDGGDWLEQMTMDVLRERLLRRLRRSDLHGRLGVYYPHRDGLAEGCIGLHSKVCVVDEDLVRIGSANLTNRSLRLDTECDLAFEARGDESIRRAIAAFRNRLLAEHLGVKPELFAETVAREGSLLGAIEHLRGNERTLMPFEPTNRYADLEPWVPGSEVVDPERSMAPDLVVNHFIHPEDRERAARRILLAAAFLFGVLSLAAAWRWTPLGEWVKLPIILRHLESVKESPAAPFLAVGAFVLGGLVVAPVTALIAGTLVIFGPVQGFVYALAGSTASAVVTYGIGHVLGRQGIRRLAGSRLNRLSRQLARRGLLSMVIAHLLPIAPFTVVNIAAGASHIRLRDFVLGTVLGMVPGMIAMAIVVDRVYATIRTPAPSTMALLGAVTAVFVLGAWSLHRLLRRRLERGETSSSDT